MPIAELHFHPCQGSISHFKRDENDEGLEIPIHKSRHCYLRNAKCLWPRVDSMSCRQTQKLKHSLDAVFQFHHERFPRCKAMCREHPASHRSIVWKLLLFNAHQCTLLGLQHGFRGCLSPGICGCNSARAPSSSHGDELLQFPSQRLTTIQDKVYTAPVTQPPVGAKRKAQKCSLMERQTQGDKGMVGC